MEYQIHSAYCITRVYYHDYSGKNTEHSNVYRNVGLFNSIIVQADEGQPRKSPLILTLTDRPGY